MPVGAIIGSAVVGAGTSIVSANKTAGAARDTANANNALTQGMYNENKQTLTPFITPAAPAADRQASFLSGAGLSGTVNAGGRQINVGPAAPQGARSGATWLDTSGAQPVLHVYDESSGRWATPSPGAEGQWLGGQSVSTILSQVSGQSGVNPDLKRFEDASGLSGPMDAVRSVYGSSEADYLRNTGQDKPTQQIADALGGNFGDYLNHSGLDKTDNAIEHFLGLDSGEGLDAFLNSTGYKLSLNTGSDAIQRSAAARGLLKSGGTLKALDKFGQDLGQTYGQGYLTNLGQYSATRQNQFGDYTGRLSGLAGLRRTQANDYTSGQAGVYDLNRNAFATYWGSTGDIASRGLQAASALAGVGQNTASQVSANNNTALAARASANATTSGAINGAVSNGLATWAYLQPQTAAVNPNWLY